MADNLITKTDSNAGKPSQSENQTPIDVTQDWVLNYVQQSLSAAKTKILADVTTETQKQIDATSLKFDAKLEKKVGEALDKATMAFTKEAEASRIGTIETLAIFVALFTFVSVNINIFSKVEYLTAAVWFMTLMAITLLIFLSVLLIFLNKQYKKWQMWLIPLGGFVVLVSLLFLGSNFENLNPRINQPVSATPQPSQPPAPKSVAK